MQIVGENTYPIPQSILRDRWGRSRQYESRGRPVAPQNKLGEWVKSSGLTRAEAASKLGCSRSHLDKLCRQGSKPSLDLANKIQEVTGIPTAYWSEKDHSKQ